MSNRIPDHQIAGDGDRTLFLLHGAYGAKDYFRYEIETLVKAGWRVVAWDAPGYGLSPLPEDFSIETAARACVRLIEKTGTAMNVVLGHSMGGIVAPRVCALMPGRIQGLIVSATSGSFRNRTPEDQKKFLAERLDPLEHSATLREAAMPVLRSMVAPGNSGPMVDLVIDVAGSTRTPTFRAAIRSIVEWDGTPTVESLRLPTLAIAGEHDNVGRPEAMKAMYSRIPGSEFAVIKGAAHYAFAERHEEFNRLLLDFLERRVLRKEKP